MMSCWNLTKQGMESDLEKYVKNTTEIVTTIFNYVIEWTNKAQVLLEQIKSRNHI